MLEPLVDPFLHFFPLVPVALLNFAFKLVATASDIEKIVVREVAPFLFQFTLELFPFALELIFIDDQHRRNIFGGEGKVILRPRSRRRLDSYDDKSAQA